MTIEIEHAYGGMPVPDFKEVIENTVNTALDAEECPYEASVYILLTDNEEIREINRAHRNIDRPTDVLSFPMAEYDPPGDFDDIEERDPDAFHPDSGELLLGDIIISMEAVKTQAAEYGHSMKRELAFLVAHSMLHLMGYDHMEEEERLVMEEKQETILKSCGYTRDL